MDRHRLGRNIAIAVFLAKNYNKKRGNLYNRVFTRIYIVEEILFARICNIVYYDYSWAKIKDEPLSDKLL